MQRASGILLHPASLPSPCGVGDLGGEAKQFIDFLAAAGQSVWQVLPIGPTGYGDSPYNALSAFAGNPLLIDIDELVVQGDLDPKAVPGSGRRVAEIDYPQACAVKLPLLATAAERFFSRREADPEREALDAFCREQAGWLDDYCLFKALREHFGRQSWSMWPMPLRHREQAALKAWRDRLAPAIRNHQYQQYRFFQQWQALRRHAADRRVRLFGDIPIFVAYDSADVWANQELFQLDDEGRQRTVAGVPPDYFSATGQRWGNPLYDWARMQETDFAWWMARFRHNFRLYDLVRIDHFRGFQACWSIPAAATTAVDGHWEEVPGQALFDCLKAEFPDPPIIAEDLGVITPAVEQLRDANRFPGMKVLQFAFDSDAENPYLPHNHHPDCVVYTGTHDNNTTRGWWQDLNRSQKDRIRDYLGKAKPDMPDDLIRLATASVARLCIMPAQDILGLGSEARLNRPGHAVGNWRWRLAPGSLDEELATKLSHLCQLYNRLP